ncbi:MAG TPA: hypothetical protein VGF60_07805 [Xanthobacteraceae bacterium]
MTERGGREALWLAIQARMYASTSGDLRTLAQGSASSDCPERRTGTIGEHRIAATTACRP